MPFVMRPFGWMHQLIEFSVSGRPMLRWSRPIDPEKFLRDAKPICWVTKLGPDAAEQVNGRVAQLARSFGATHGHKLNGDILAVETKTLSPTDIGFIGDGVHVVLRFFRRVMDVLGHAAAMMGLRSSVSWPDS